MVLNVSSVAAQDLQCPDGQVVMEYTGMAPDMLTGFSMLNISVTSAAYDEDNFSYFQAWPDTPTFVPFCVPADKCLTVKIQVNTDTEFDTEFPPFSVIYDATTLTLLGPFPRDPFVFYFYGQVGASCEVACDDDHVLLEIEAMTGQFYDDYDWQVIDDSTNEVVRACLPDATPLGSNDTYYTKFCYWSADSWFRDRVCVPKDGCYRFVAGDDASYFYVSTLKVSLGGESVLQAEPFRFETVLLLHSESPDACSSTTTSACQGKVYPSEEEMEIFIFHSAVLYDDTAVLTWNAKLVDPNGSTNEVETTVVAGGRPLQYKRLCIPGCASFDVSSMSSNSYEVRVDGTIYVQSPSGIGFVDNEVFISDSDYKRPYIVGSLCRSNVCEGSGQSLVEVGIRYAPQLPDSYRETGGRSLSTNSWEVNDIPKFKVEPDAQFINPLVYGEGLPRRQLGKSYRNQFCLKDWYVAKESNNGGCTALMVYLGGESMTESYSVSVNGKLFSDRLDCSVEAPLGFRAMCEWFKEYRSSSSAGVIMTPLNGNCKMKGIPGYIAGGTVMGFLLIAGLGYYWIKRRRVAASKESNDVGIESSQIPASTSVGQTADVAGE